MSHLTTTPELYGDTYQVLFSSGGSPLPDNLLPRLQHDRAITRVMLGTREEVSINGVSVFAIAEKAVRGPLFLSTVGGRLPECNGDISVGATTLHRVGATAPSSDVRELGHAGRGAARSIFRVVASPTRRRPDGVHHSPQPAGVTEPVIVRGSTGWRVSDAWYTAKHS